MAKIKRYIKIVTDSLKGPVRHTQEQRRVYLVYQMFQTIGLTLTSLGVYAGMVHWGSIIFYVMLIIYGYLAFRPRGKLGEWRDDYKMILSGDQKSELH